MKPTDVWFSQIFLNQGTIWSPTWCSGGNTLYSSTVDRMDKHSACSSWLELESLKQFPNHRRDRPNSILPSALSLCPCLFHLSFLTWLLHSPFPCLLPFLFTQTFGLSAQPVLILLFLLHPLLADPWFSQFPPHSPIPKAYTPSLIIFVQPSQIIPCSDGLHPNLVSITLKHKLLTPAVGFPLVSNWFTQFYLLPLKHLPDNSPHLVIPSDPSLPTFSLLIPKCTFPSYQVGSTLTHARNRFLIQGVWVVFESTEETGCGVIRASSTWPRTHRSWHCREDLASFLRPCVGTGSVCGVGICTF